jgi:hypothetical protein
MPRLLKIALMMIFLLTSLFRTSPARAEFSTAFIAAGIAIGIGLAEISHSNDKKCDDVQNNVQDDKSGQKE